MNKYGISNDAYMQMIDTFNQIPEIKKVILFGSRARGDYKKTSDIDLAVIFDGENQKLKLIRLLDEIKCILKFDVLNFDTLSNNELISNIKKDGVIIWEK